MAENTRILVAVFGAAGRMGSEVLAALPGEKDITVSYAVDVATKSDRNIHGFSVIADGPEVGREADVWVDVSLAEAAHRHALRAAKLGIPILIGATGFNSGQLADLHALSCAHILAPNLSRGVNLLFELTARAAKTLQGFDAGIIETHHRHKLDRPSGTASKLRERLAEAGMDAETVSLRIGEVVGEHRVVFAAEGETLELVHRASSRAAFARGVAPAVRFLHGKTAGEFTMADALGLNR